MDVPLVRRALVAFALLGVLGCWFAYLSVYQVDDAYIVYRYAENLGRGHGFVYNVGDRVEGITCFLWTLLLALFSFLPFPLPGIAPVLTALASTGILLLLPRTSARMQGRASPTWRDWAPSILLAAHPAFAYWSVGALETIPYAALLSLSLHDHLRERAVEGRQRSALWIGLAALMRPETPLLAALLLGDRICERIRTRRPGWLSDAGRWCGVAGACYFPFLMFRRLYFGEWVPNTYYAKMGAGILANVEEGSRYSLDFFSSLIPGFGLSTPITGFLGFVLLAAVLSFALPRPNLRPAALLVCGIGLATLLEGGDWMVLHRFWAPATPAIMLLLVATLGALTLEAPRLRRPILILLTLLACSGVVAAVRARDGINGLAVNAAGYRFAHSAVGRFLKNRAEPDDVVALMDIGIIGYESGLQVRDISGLTDREIARSPGAFLNKVYPPERILDDEPRFIVLVPGFVIDDRITKHPDFQEHYRLVFERNHRFNWTPPGVYPLRVFERIGRGP